MGNSNPVSRFIPEPAEFEISDQERKRFSGAGADCARPEEAGDTRRSTCHRLCPRERSHEKRDWVNYAERTAQAAFGALGDREATRSMPRSRVWMQVEGREPSREAITRRESPMRSRNIHQKSFEPEM